MSGDQTAMTTGPPADGAADESELWLAFKSEGSLEARERLFQLHAPFAKRIAARRRQRLAGADVDYRELCQLAFTGLLEALDRFNPALGIPFRGYAARRILGSVLDGIAKMSELRQQISLRHRMRAERLRSLVAEDTDRLSATEAMDALADLAIGLAVGFMLEGTGLYVHEGQPDPRPLAYESAAWNETVAHVVGEVSRLPEREQAVVRYHYLEGLSFDQIAALLRVSKGRISQIHKTAMERLRSRLPAAETFHLQR
jgi:RNA polymerase sigma factor for flagellar operon FliA